MKTKEELLSELLVGEVSVTFRKKDGSERVMKCTKSFDIIPEEFQPKKSGESAASNTDLITVWDTEKTGWRSFDWKSVIHIGDSA